MAKDVSTSQWGHKRNMKGTVFFVCVLLYKLFHGGFFFFRTFAPDFWLDYFDMQLEGYDFDWTFYLFLLIGLVCIAQIIITIIALVKPLFFQAGAKLKGIPFLLNLILALAQIFLFPALMMYTAFSAIGLIIDIVVTLTFYMKPTSSICKLLHPFSVTPNEEERNKTSSSPRKEISTV